MAKLYVKEYDVDSKLPWLYIILTKSPVDIVIFKPGDTQHTLMNPAKILPFLLDEDVKIWGTVAVLLYLTQKFGNNLYHGQNADEKAKINSILYWTGGPFYRSAITNFVRPQQSEPFYKLPGNDNQLLIQHGKKNITDHLDTLEKQYFTKKKYVHGDAETIADFYICNILMELERFKFDFSKWPKTEKWFHEMSQKVIVAMP
ncbi:glutathione S-transferase D2-like isoform X2 [Hydractinia symbiolongicarpus]|nr:glutathione S-transferase D2-like isoform X2 [Hydractinia symbiolongicarpus]